MHPSAGGAAANIHMSGGAVDLRPVATDAGPMKVAKVCSAAIAHDPELVLPAAHEVDAGCTSGDAVEH